MLAKLFSQDSNFYTDDMDTVAAMNFYECSEALGINLKETINENAYQRMAEQNSNAYYGQWFSEL